MRHSASKIDPLNKLPSAAPVFAALGDQTRLELVARLCAGGPRSITHLTAGSAVTRQAITKHLRVLAGAGLVRCTHRGRERIWEFETDRLDVARECLDEISKRWDSALGRLKKFVEG
jgi:DNA-binding transcriptional ArsR family regulator